jgi:hypothetical protein
VSDPRLGSAAAFTWSKMMHRWMIVLVLVGVGTLEPARAADRVLAANGKSDYQIVIPDKAATPALEEALRQTARLVQAAFRANGAELPVTTEAKRDPARPALYLGDTAFLRQQKIDLAGLRGWGYVQRVVGRDVILAGRDHPAPAGGNVSHHSKWDRVGTAKAAADFLRQFAGVRFLYPDVPPWTPVAGAARIDFLTSPAIEFLKTPVIGVPENLDVRKIPLVDYNTSYPETGGFYDLANNRLPRVDVAFSGHTYERAVPVEKYKDTHPEYFALIGGKRAGAVPGNAQYCIGNPEVRELIYRDLVEWLDRGYESVDLGQPDGFRPCQCADCAKLYGTGGDWSEKLWLFHRELAERVRKVHPDRRVIMMSYIQTASPPRTFRKFPANTAIMLTGTNEDDIAPWRSVEVPGGFTCYLYNWCPNLGTRYTPMRTPRYVEEQVKRLVNNRFRSIYRDGPGTLFGLEGPVYYTMGRMFDDPAQLQAKNLVHEFCEAAFGRAAGPMIQFYDRLYHGIELYSEFLGTRSPAWTYQNIYGQSRKFLTDPFQFLGFLYTPSLLAELEAQLTQAERTAATEKVKTRLALVRREFNYLKGLARVVHLHQAFELQPDVASRNRLLDALDARNAEIAAYFNDRGHTKPIENWAYTLFPPPGHDAKHMRLGYDGYQEPYANTCFNWDTKAMRTAPLPGAKRVNVAAVRGPVALNAADWDKAPTLPLSALPTGSPITRATTARVLADEANLYVRVEAELPGEPLPAKDAKTSPERLTLIVAPDPGRELAYRFTIGLTADAKQDAALGLVTDPLDPRYGKFDTDWTGPWKHESHLDPAGNRWLALFAIPFKTVGADAPKPGTFWRANVSRVHVAGPGKIEQSLWSATPSARTLDDLNDLGELAFPSDAPDAPKKNALKETREALYRQTFLLPDDWKKLADPLPTPLGPWRFRKDLLEQGLAQRWQLPETATDDWTPIDVPSFWAENPAVGDFQGYGWYRTTFTIPMDWKGRSIRILFGAADEQAWVYVNGQLVREHTEKSERKPYTDLWELPFTAEVPAERLLLGKPNTLVVRVHNALANGGLWRPVLIHATPRNAEGR